MTPDAAPARWELFAHGADVGVRGIGDTCEAAFEQAALALTAIVTDPAGVRPRETVDIECRAAEPEAMLVDWLGAVIAEMSARRLVFCRFEVRFDDGRLRGHATGEPVDVARHEPAVEPKGATWSGLSVAQKPDGRWVAQAVVDV